MGRISDKVTVGHEVTDTFMMGRMYVEKKLYKSFGTLEEAKRFAQGKDVLDIYRCKGKYKVEWRKITYVES